MNLRKLRWGLILYVLFDLYIGGHCGGFIPLNNAAAAQTLLAQGGVGVSCNAVTVATSANPGTAAGCTALALVTSGGTLPGNYTWQTIITGSPASVTVNFMGSLDGTTWTQVDTTSSTTGVTRTVANANSYRFLGCVPATLSSGSLTCQISVTSTASGGGLPSGLTYVAPTFTVSSSGNGNGQVALSGNTSGTATITAPAVAGTSTNLLAISNAIQLPGGGASLCSICWSGDTTTGIRQGGSGNVTMQSAGSVQFRFGGGAEVAVAGSQIGWTNSTVDPSTGLDTSLSRSAAGVLQVGTTTTNSQGVIQAASYMSGGTTFTSSGGCAEGTLTGGATAGKFTTSGSTSCTTIVTMGNSATAPHGWDCHALDLTTVGDVTNPHQTSSTTTTATFASGTIVAGDVIQFSCIGY